MSNISGIDASSSNEGRVIVIQPASVAGPVTFVHEDTGITASNRFQLPDDADLTISQGGAIAFRRVGSRWNLLWTGVNPAGAPHTMASHSDNIFDGDLIPDTGFTYTLGDDDLTAWLSVYTAEVRVTVGSQEWSGEGGSIVFRAEGSVDGFKSVAAITAYVDENPQDNDSPGQLLFKTTSDSSETPTTKWSILANGDFKPATDLGQSIGDLSTRVGTVFADAVSVGVSGVQAQSGYFLNLAGATGGGVVMRTGATQLWVFQSNGHLVPQSNGAYDFGLTGDRVRTVYANTVNGDTSLVLRGVTMPAITVAASAPGSPATGDLWIDTS